MINSFILSFNLCCTIYPFLVCCTKSMFCVCWTIYPMCCPLLWRNVNLKCCFIRQRVMDGENISQWTVLSNRLTRLPGAVPQQLFWFYMFQVGLLFYWQFYWLLKKNEGVFHFQFFYLNNMWGRLPFKKN
jgi:hypothetical protein